MKYIIQTYEQLKSMYEEKEEEDQVTKSPLDELTNIPLSSEYIEYLESETYYK